MLKLIVTSATWQQSSTAGRELLALDPENRLMARGRASECPQRLSGQALAGSGLLVERLVDRV